MQRQKNFTNYIKKRPDKIQQSILTLIQTPTNPQHIPYDQEH